jgi:FkbM family methyltransferase
MSTKDLLPLGMKAEPVAAHGHHLIFDRFERTRPFSDERFHYNFMGARIAHEFERDLIDVVPGFDRALASGLKASGRSVIYDDDPTFPSKNSEDYFEWIDLLTAIDRAGAQFTMIELGAGYGRWIANAAAAQRRRKNKSVSRLTLIALEASKARYELMGRNCVHNEIPAADCKLMRAACTCDGRPVFMVCNDDYGTGIAWNADAMKAFELAQSDVITARDERGWSFQVERVPAVRLDELLTEPVDFIDFDIQGAELDVIFAAIDAMDACVKMAHVGTHSLQVDARLSHIFHLHGWRPRRIFTCGSVNQTPYGTFQFIDGIQSWENPRFS